MIGIVTGRGQEEGEEVWILVSALPHTSRGRLAVLGMGLEGGPSLPPIQRCSVTGHEEMAGKHIA